MKRILLIFAVLLAGVVTFQACKKTVIKLKRLKGEWKVSSISITTIDNETETIEFNDSGCDVNNEAGTDETTTTTTVTYSGTTFEKREVESNGTIVGTTETFTLTMTIKIDEEGTYDISGTYNYDYTDPTTNDVTNYSGSFSTDKNSWYFADSDKKNSAVVFENFPEGISTSSIRFSGSPFSFYADRRMDVDESEKDKITFIDSETWNHEDVTVYPEFDTLGQDDCVRTKTKRNSGSREMTMELTQ